jgi:hypothetical protein
MSMPTWPSVGVNDKLNFLVAPLQPIESTAETSISAAVSSSIAAEP